MVNKVTLIGNLGADPEVKTSQGGMTIANMRIATTERRKGQNGEYTDHTEWHRVSCFAKTAENVAKFLHKGSKVYIEGSLRTSSYEKDGEKRYTTEIVANDVRFLDSKGQGERTAPVAAERDDEIPF